MKSLKCYIQKETNINEGFKIGKTKAKSYYTCYPKNKNELKEILEERLKYDHNANLNDIDVSEITDMSRLFIFLNPGNINISEWNVSKVTDMSFMFFECIHFNCDLSNWDVSNVKDMRCMFESCNDFEGEGLENWDTTNVKFMAEMFDYCVKIKNKPSWYR